MRWSRIGHKFFYITNCMPKVEKQAAADAVKHAHAAVGEAGGRSLNNGANSWHRPRTMASVAQERKPAVNFDPFLIVETEEAFKMRVDLPGLVKEEVKVYVEDGRLLIKGAHSLPKKAEESEWASRNQITLFSTRVTLPNNVNAKMSKAELKNGVLSVTVPKVAKEKLPSVIDVQIE